MSDFDVRVRIYEMIDGEPLSSLLDYPLSYFGSCPNVGGTIAIDYADEHKFYSVSRRYNIRLRGWAIIVRAIPASAQIDAVMTAWKEDDEWDAEIEAEEALQAQKQYERDREHRQLVWGKPPPEINFDHREEPVVKRLSRRGVLTRLLVISASRFAERSVGGWATMYRDSAPEVMYKQAVSQDRRSVRHYWLIFCALINKIRQSDSAGLSLA